MIEHNIAKEKIESIFRLIPDLAPFHDRENDLYRRFSGIVEPYFTNYESDVIDVVPLDGLVWPHTSLGNLTSYNFFCSFDEWILYSFYWVNRNRYRTAMDIGANIGIDSIILSRFGYEVYSFEPDPQLYQAFTKNLELNQCKGIHPYQKAMSDRAEVVDFVRVNGNTTANHIRGVRDFYGDAEFLKVETIAFQDVGVRPDLMKINVEGHEGTIVASIGIEDWREIDAFVEIHNQENGESIFRYFQGSGMNIFAQQLGWQKVVKLEDMPITNKVGYIFVSAKQEMPWTEPHG
jgi:FkbM family methyltransferase